MLTKINTAALSGVSGYAVNVELDMHRGMPCFDIVGLADITIKESSRRIRPAIMNSGYRFPNERITVNLAPAGRHKEGSHFDLPIALGIILLQQEKINADLSDTAFFGEISLDGKVNRVKGALPLAIALRKAGVKKICVPRENAEEVSVLEDIKILPIESLTEAVDYINGRKQIAIHKRKEKSGHYYYDEDFSQVKGQESVKRAAIIGAAGNHGMMMIGGPGCGKTMIARRMPTILPELTYEEKLEITGIYSVAGLLTEDESIISSRPFRSPHHTITAAGLVGGGTRPRPGELSLAHRGVLFLDEFGEFSPKTIDAARQPVEDGFVRLSRNMEEIIFPSKTMVIAAANPCKCGYLWDERHPCSCTGKQIDSYRRKLCGPFSDRIDMHIRIFPVLAGSRFHGGEILECLSSADMRRQVERAGAVQRKRYEGTSFSCNGDLNEKGISEFCVLKTDGRELLDSAYEKYGMTMRSYAKVLKISRTIADLADLENIECEHVAEALMYRISDWDNK